MDHEPTADRMPEPDRDALMVPPDDEGMPTPRAVEQVAEAEDLGTGAMKTVSCRDVGIYADCGDIMRGKTEAEVMQAAAAHGQQHHGMTYEELSDPRTQQRVRDVIRDA